MESFVCSLQDHIPLEREIVLPSIGGANDLARHNRMQQCYDTWAMMNAVICQRKIELYWSNYASIIFQLNEWTAQCRWPINATRVFSIIQFHWFTRSYTDQNEWALNGEKFSFRIHFFNICSILISQAVNSFPFFLHSPIRPSTIMGAHSFFASGFRSNELNIYYPELNHRRIIGCIKNNLAQKCACSSKVITTMNN